MTKKARQDERRPATPEGEVRRRKILDAATRLFSAGGFNSASIADVAAAVGITSAGVLHYFPSKRELLLAVLRDRQERNALAREEAMAHGEDWLQAFMQTLSANDESPALVQLFAVLSAESITDGHPAQEWFQQHYERAVSAARDALAEVVDPTALPDGVTVEIMARWFVAVADGWRLQWLHDTTIPSRQESLSLLLEMFVPGLQHKEGEGA